MMINGDSKAGERSKAGIDLRDNMVNVCYIFLSSKCNLSGDG
jgi:hypothetical protein